MIGVRDDSWKFGAGNYFQRAALLETAGHEIKKYGHHPYLVGGAHALAATAERLSVGIKAAGLEAVTREYSGQCCMKAAEALISEAREKGCDVIVGAGGGRMMDLCKLIADRLNLPVLLIPTSAATCAAYTPFSRVYTPESATVRGNDYREREVDAILADMDVMACQPVRCLFSGVLDAMAKAIELWHLSMDCAPVGLYSASLLANHAKARLDVLTPAACEALKTHAVTPALDETVFINIALTGIISGLSRGVGQTDIAHDFYYLIREFFTAQALNFYHGELVGIGCILQLIYDGRAAACDEWTLFLSEHGVPTTLRGIGIEPNDDVKALILRQLCPKEHGRDAERVRAAIEHIAR